MEVIEEEWRVKGERGRPRQKFLDWMMSEEYDKLKEEAQHRETRNVEPLEVWTCQRVENLNKKKK